MTNHASVSFDYENGGVGTNITFMNFTSYIVTNSTG